MPDYFQRMKNSSFEIGPVFVLSSGSVEHFLQLQGGTALIDRRRFRPNLFVDSGSDTDHFVEDDWLGHTLAIDETAALDQFQPTLWCVTSTLAQEELPRDLSIPRTTAREHKGCLGVYASVNTPGGGACRRLGRASALTGTPWHERSIQRRVTRRTGAQLARSPPIAGPFSRVSITGTGAHRAPTRISAALRRNQS